MKTVFDPPEEIYVLGYVWQRNGASGGQQELFTSKEALARRLEQLVEDKDIETTRAKAFQLYVQDQVKSLEISWPQGVTVR